MKKIFALILIAALALSASAVLAEGKLESIAAAGKLVVGTDAAWPPFEYIGANGEPDGSDIEIGKWLAEQLGVTLEVKNIAFDTLSTALNSGEIDLAIAAITITDERKEEMDFTSPYTVAQQYIIVNGDNDSVTYFEDLAGMGIGVHLGTTGDFMVSDAVMLPDGALYNTGASVHQYKFLTDACLALKNGELGAVVCDTLLAKNLCVVNPDLKCFELMNADGSMTIEQLGIMMKKGDAEFLSKIDGLLKQIIDDGSVDKWILEHTEKAAELD